MKKMSLGLILAASFSSVFAMETDGVVFDNEAHVSFYSQDFEKLETIDTDGFGELITVSVRRKIDEVPSDVTYQAERSTKFRVLNITEDGVAYKLYPYHFKLKDDTYTLYLSTQYNDENTDIDNSLYSYKCYFVYVLDRHEVCCKLTREAFNKMLSGAGSETEQAAARADLQQRSNKSCFLL